MTINQVFHARSKHIEIDYHFVCEKVFVGASITRYIPSSQQVADVFTKPLAAVPFMNFCNKLGVHSVVSSSLRKGEESQQQPTKAAPKLALSIYMSTVPSVPSMKATNLSKSTAPSICTTAPSICTTTAPSIYAISNNKIFTDIVKNSAISLGL